MVHYRADVQQLESGGVWAVWATGKWDRFRTLRRFVRGGWKLGLLSKNTYQIDNQPSAVAERKAQRRAGCCWKHLFRWCLRCRNPEKRSSISNQEHLLAMHTMEKCGVDDPGHMHQELPPTTSIRGAAEVP